MEKTSNHGRAQRDDPVDALNCVGYSNGAVRALDFWETGDDHAYVRAGCRWVLQELQAMEIADK